MGSRVTVLYVNSGFVSEFDSFAGKVAYDNVACVWKDL